VTTFDRPDLMPPNQTPTNDQNLPPDATGQPSVGVLPPGVHPLDNSQVVLPGQLPDAGDMGLLNDSPGIKFDRGRSPFGTAQEEALGVFQRLASDWSTGLVVVDVNQGGAVKVVGRQRGRSALQLWVPTSVIGPLGTVIATPAGVIIGPTENEVQQTFSATILMPGDSMTVLSEGSVWAGLQPAQTVGYVQYANYYTPAGNPVASAGLAS
jgi:hypothetical protein